MDSVVQHLIAIQSKKKKRSNPSAFFHTEDRNRTDMELPPPDFESGASTSSATPANESVMHNYRLWVKKNQKFSR